MKTYSFKIGQGSIKTFSEYKSPGYTMTNTYDRRGRIMCKHLEFSVIRKSIGAIRKIKVQLAHCVIFQRKRYHIYELDEASDGRGNFMYKICCKYEPNIFCE